MKEWANQWCPLALTTLTSCDMETSNSTVTGSDTFSTGLMNWLYLLNNLRNKRSSDFDEVQPEGRKRKRYIIVYRQCGFTLHVITTKTNVLLQNYLIRVRVLSQIWTLVWSYREKEHLTRIWQWHRISDLDRPNSVGQSTERQDWRSYCHW